MVATINNLFLNKINIIKKRFLFFQRWLPSINITSLHRDDNVIANNMKYIMLKEEKDEITFFYPIIFPHNLVHEQIAISMLEVLPNAVVHSAGEVSLFELDNKCHGFSETLGVESDSEADTVRLKMADYGGLIEG